MHLSATGENDLLFSLSHSVKQMVNETNLTIECTSGQQREGQKPRFGHLQVGIGVNDPSHGLGGGVGDRGGWGVSVSGVHICGVSSILCITNSIIELPKISWSMG